MKVWVIAAALAASGVAVAEQKPGQAPQDRQAALDDIELASWDDAWDDDQRSPVVGREPGEPLTDLAAIDAGAVGRKVDLTAVPVQKVTGELVFVGPSMQDSIPVRFEQAQKIKAGDRVDVTGSVRRSGPADRLQGKPLYIDAIRVAPAGGQHQQQQQ